MVKVEFTRNGFKTTLKEDIAAIYEKRGTVKILGKAKADGNPDENAGGKAKADGK
jgi:hypothetical protein